MIRGALVHQATVWQRGFDCRVGPGHDEDWFPFSQRTTRKEEGRKRGRESGISGESNTSQLSARTSTITLHRILSRSLKCTSSAPYQKMEGGQKVQEEGSSKKKEGSKGHRFRNGCRASTDWVGGNEYRGGIAIRDEPLPKQETFGIMRQLLSDVDSDTVNEGWIQSHLDEFIWDGLKVCHLNPWIPFFITDFCLKG